MKLITKTVWILSLVSLFADIASEMLYPVVPVYLKEIGFSILLIGILEGVAELTVGLSKGYFGKRSDELGFRLPFVKLGYFLSALSKPLMAILSYPIWIFFVRTTDRLGKGVRTAARDALLSQEATIETKARVFAFHRGWDTLGAVAGPLLALAFLYQYPSQYTLLFYIAFIPGIISVAFIFLLKEKKKPVSTITKQNFFSFLSYRKIANPQYKTLVTGLLIFALANSSDFFLLLRAKEITQSDNSTIAAYILYNLIYAVSSYPIGILADKIGIKKIFLFGLFLFAVVYSGFAVANSSVQVFLLFALYGIYAAATEGIAKAWLTNMAHEKNTATAIGYYSSLQSIAAFLASLMAGVIWQWAGSQIVFWIAASISLIAFGYLLFQKMNTSTASH